MSIINQRPTGIIRTFDVTVYMDSASGGSLKKKLRKNLHDVKSTK